MLLHSSQDFQPSQMTQPVPDSQLALKHQSPSKSQNIPWAMLIGSMGKLELFEDKEYVIGRHRTCDIQLDNLQVSNRHCRIYQKDCSGENFAFIMDTSTNGSFINGQRMVSDTETLLHHNDHIEILPNGFYFIYQDPAVLRIKMQDNSETSSFGEFMILDRIIGRGAFGVVKVGVEKCSGLRVACKIIFKDKIKSQPNKAKLLIHHIKQEIDILRTIQHPNLIRTWRIFEQPSCIAIMMELVDGGDLLQYLEKRERIPEEEARFGFYQLIKALEYLHSMNMCHRDLKPENILVGSLRAYPRLVITDFGLAKAKINETQLKTFCGTMGYIAPEVIVPNEGYTKAVDCWSLGVILYSMMAGYFPFPDESDAALAQAVREANFDFRSTEWLSISDEAQDIISKLIVVDPTKRLTIREAFRHSWISVFIPDLEIMYKVYVTDQYQKTVLDKKSQ